MTLKPTHLIRLKIDDPLAINIGPFTIGVRYTSDDGTFQDFTTATPKPGTTLHYVDISTSSG